MDISKFRQLPILGIMRGVEEGTIDGLIESAFSAGLRAIEITMNTPDAPLLIKKAQKAANGRIYVGAGTVLSMSDMMQALDSGAQFIVMPALVNDVVEYCARNKIPVFPGALTPQEILNAWRSGATMVKVFPAKFFGPAYFSEIKGPFNNIELLACGGVEKENIRAFFSAGASAVAFGASIFRKEWIASGDFSQIKDEIKKLIAASGF